jgi:thiol-disulfide isomerase/thioredoxin
MKKLILFLGLIISAGCIQAQTNLAIPHYHILKADSTMSSWADLNTHKPVMLIYFSPDCPHCQHLTLEMKQKMDNFKNIQIVMITFTRTEYPYMKMIRDFNRDYGLLKYKNITMGTEYPDYFVQRYFQIETTPYVAVYNKEGKLVKGFKKAPEMDDLIAAVKKAE